MPREVTHLLIGSVYHPPKANNFEMSEYLNSTMDIITRSHPNAGILLLGDFNQLPECHQKFSPLHQLVTRATRGSSVLDKVFTNVPTWYQIPVLLPAVTRSDDPPRPPKNPKVTYRRLLTPNRQALLFHHLSHFNWTPLFHMSTCEEMVNFFYSTILQLLDFYTPLTRKSTNNLDKPWVTTEFRHLVKQRQRAFLGSQTEHYRKLRNKVQRMAATLRKRFYTRKIEYLHSADPHFW